MFRDLNMNRAIQLQPRMKYPLLALALSLVILSGCGKEDGFRTLFHEESLSSGPEGQGHDARAGLGWPAGR